MSRDGNSVTLPRLEPMLIEIIDNGHVINTVTPQELFDLAAMGVIEPQTAVCINGKLGTAGQLQGLVFGYVSSPGNVGSYNVSHGMPNALVPSSAHNYGGAPVGFHGVSNVPPPPTPPPVVNGSYGVPNSPPVAHHPVYMQQPVYGPHPYQNTNSSDNGAAVTSLIMGILGLVACIIPLFGLPITIIGLVCGCLGVSGKGRSMAIAGIVLCVIGLLSTSLILIGTIMLAASGQL